MIFHLQFLVRAERHGEKEYGGREFTENGHNGSVEILCTHPQYAWVHLAESKGIYYLSISEFTFKIAESIEVLS